jgi:sulfoxide reductase heme-binding subunit YedZ
MGLLLLDWVNGRLGSNPTTAAQHRVGQLAIAFLLLTLAITPARKIIGWNALSHFRRMLGLFAFFYACVHFTIYFAVMRRWDVGAVWTEVAKLPFILFGMIGLALMLPLAITSTNGMIKRLGAKRWKMLHKLVYIAAIAAVVHFWMGSGKIVTMRAKLYAVALAILLGYRIVDALLPAGLRKKATPVPRTMPAASR